MNQLHSIQYNGQTFSAIGNVELLQRHKLGLLCSRKCPADKILEAYEQFKSWAKNPQITVLSGFHSPLEKECLHLFLKGKANSIICPARSIERMRIPTDWLLALKNNRILILSSFSCKRADRQTSLERNNLIQKIADKQISFP